MQIMFEKYHGTGNDFIMIDGRGSGFIIPETGEIARLCDRRFGIGADGLIIVQYSRKYDFVMRYYNSDGREGTLCGNGGRCAAAYCLKLGMTGMSTQFEAIDGIHKASIEESGMVHLEMNNVSDIRFLSDHYELDTGSPHYVKFVDQVKDVDMAKTGAEIRYGTSFKDEGINVNFVSETAEGLFVRTYERGVENETLSCGTGVVASALCAAIRSETDKKSFPVQTPGGNLEVTFERTGETNFGKIVLSGLVTFVYRGEIELS